MVSAESFIVLLQMTINGEHVVPALGIAIGLQVLFQLYTTKSPYEGEKLTSSFRYLLKTVDQPLRQQRFQLIECSIDQPQCCSSDIYIWLTLFIHTFINDKSSGCKHRGIKTQNLQKTARLSPDIALRHLKGLSIYVHN